VKAPAGVKLARYPVETALLLALCFSLPLLEAPKSIIWLAYGLTWLVNRVRERNFGGPWDGWDSLIAVWIVSGFVGAAFAGLKGGEWSGAGDLLRYASVLWMVKRSGYGVRETRWMLGTLVTSAVIGLAIAHGRLLGGQANVLELHSVGHVNHTAIYLAIMLGVCVAWIFARWHAWRVGLRAFALAVAALVMASLVITASRGALGVALLLLPLLALAWWPRSRIPLGIAIAVVLAVMVAAVAGGATVVKKHWDNVEAENVLSYRDGIWRAALAAWERHPWFGLGLDNYKRITPERLRAWDQAAGRPHDPERYFLTSHGHSVYATALAERGVVGTGVLLAVIAAWAYSLIRYRPRRADPDEHWLVWGCATSAWLVTVVAGIVNTTLHHEHGLLAALLLGLWLLRRTEARKSEPARALAG
jgi:O-antigen ligase